MSRIFTPREYQSLAIDFILRTPRGNLWADMGMGKTSSCLFAVNALRFIDDCFPGLVLAPLLVASETWPAEARKWSQLDGLRVQPLTGAGRAEREEALNTPADVYTINYENLPWLASLYKSRWPFKMIVADESTRLKSYRARGGGVRAKALREYAFSCVKRFINLTGTPSPNGLQDLWGQQWFIDRGEALGRSYSSFVKRYFTPVNMYAGHQSRIEPLPYAEKQIMERVTPSALTLRAKDWFDLREPIERIVSVNLPESVLRSYKELEREYLTEIEHTPDPDTGAGETELLKTDSAAARNMKLLQLAAGAVYTDDSGLWKEVHRAKLQALDSIVSEAAGKNILVAYFFKSDLARIRKAFPQCEHLKRGTGVIDRWNAGKVRMLAAHPQSAGHGLNLQDGGHIIVFFSHWWDLEARQQIIERIGPVRQRQAGYDRPVYIYNIVAASTIDRAVLTRHAEKKSVQDALLDYKREECVAC